MEKYLHLLIIFAFLFVSCSDDSDVQVDKKHMHVLPLDVNLSSIEETKATRIYFKGSKEINHENYRMLYWNEDDEIAVYSQYFTGAKNKYDYKIHITETSDGLPSKVVLYGTEDIAWWDSGSKALRCVFPSSKFNASETTGDNLTLEVEAVQSGAVDEVQSSGTKDYCPSGQEGAYTSYNVCDYSNCIMATSSNITTAGGKPSGGMLNFYPVIKAVDVILDAPSSGTIKVSKVKVEVGTVKSGTFQDQIEMTGKIKPADGSFGSITSNQEHVDGTTSTYAQLNFEHPVSLSGKNRIVARLFATRCSGQNGRFDNKDVRITVDMENTSGTKRQYRQIIHSGSSSAAQNNITHFYLGPVPTF